jgi:opacity protein-like surface antigen
MTSPTPTSRRRYGRAAAVIALLIAAAAFGRASAADLDDSYLRGGFTEEKAPGYVRWDGVVFGATIGRSNMTTDFGAGTSSQIAYILRNSTLEDEAQPSSWTTLPKNITSSNQFGGFVGYNWQWDELVLGADIAYNHPSSLESNASDSIDRIVTTSDSVTHDVLLQSQASFKLVDYATVRGRAGYAFGQFLPYGMLGVGIGRFNYSVSATVTDHQSGAVVGTFGPVTQTDAKDGVIDAGLVVGAGLDVAVLPNVFLRAEWEYIIWAPVNSIKSTLNTGRVGVAVRF